MNLITVFLFLLTLGALNHSQDEGESTCNINNYRHYIFDTRGGHNCDLRGADLYGADLRRAKLIGANLTDANMRGANFTEAKVDPDLGAYLTSQGISGFIVKKIYL